MNIAQGVKSLFLTEFVSAFNDHLLERPAVQALLSASPPRHDAEALVAELDRLRTDVLNAYGAIIDAAPAGV